jgi:alpha-beta hydrolase superfamily lysophospholipase
MEYTLRIYSVIAAVFVGLAALSGTAHANGHVYLLKGFAGIFSTGLDTLDEKLIKHGISATVHSYDDYDSLALEAAHLEKRGKGPVVIIGHSLGADAAIYMADKMKAIGAPVALVVTFGPNGRLVAPSNVIRVVNYYLSGATISKGPGFKGTISNVSLDTDSDINHFNIEKINRLHARVIAKIQSIFARGHNGQTPLAASPPARPVNTAKSGTPSQTK